MDIGKLGKSAVLYTIGTLSVRAVSFVLLPVYTRYLTTEDYGILEMIELIITVSTLILGLGSIGSSMVRIYHDYTEKKDKDLVISSTLITCFIISITIAIIGYFCSPFIAQRILHNPEYTMLVFLSFASVIIANQVEISLLYLRIKDKPLFFVIVQILQTLMMLSLNIYFIVFRGYGIWGFVYSKLITFSFGTIFLLGYIYKKVAFKWSYTILNRMMSFGTPLIASSLAFFVMHFADRFFISELSTMDEVGIYSLGYKFGFLVTMLVGEPFGRAWNVKLFSYAKEPDWPKKFADVFAYLFLFLLVVLVVLSYMSTDIMTIMVGPVFRTAAYVIPAVALGYFFRECGDFFRQLLFINKRSHVVMVVALISAAINIILNYLLIKRWGMYGAMYSTLITWSVYCLMLYFISQKEHKIPYRIRMTLLISVISAIGFSGIYYIPVPNIIYSVGVHSVIIIAVLGLIWKSGYLTQSERIIVISKVSSYYNKFIKHKQLAN